MRIDAVGRRSDGRVVLAISIHRQVTTFFNSKIHYTYRFGMHFPSLLQKAHSELIKICIYKTFDERREAGLGMEIEMKGYTCKYDF